MSHGASRPQQTQPYRRTRRAPPRCHRSQTPRQQDQKERRVEEPAMAEETPVGDPECAHRNRVQIGSHRQRTARDGHWRRDRRNDFRSPSRPAAERWAAVIQRRPVIAVAVSTAAILALAAPALGMKLSMPDESAEARGTMGYASYATMARGFGPGFDAPLIIAAKLPAPGASTVRASMGGLAAAVRAT